MTTATRTRKPLAPVAGVVKMLKPVGAVNDRTGEVQINDRRYYFEPLPKGYRLTGFNPQKLEVVVYDLPLDLSSCDCADTTFRGERPGGCKHRRALQALRAAGRI